MVPFVPSSLFAAAKWTLDVLDDWGERLAFMFGITSPRFAAQIDAAKRSAKHDAMRSATHEQQFAGWQSGRTPPAQQHGYENPAMDASSEGVPPQPPHEIRT